MTIVTSKGKTFEVLWCWAPTGDGSLMLAMRDTRRLPEIAADFDGLDRIERSSEEEGDKVYEGYGELAGISRNTVGDVVIKLVKP